jgi:hypothetical protein
MFEEGVVARTVFEQPRGDELDDFVGGGAPAARRIDAHGHRARPRTDNRYLHPPVAMDARDAKNVEIPDIRAHQYGQRLMCSSQLTLDVELHLCLQYWFRLAACDRTMAER